MPVALAAKAELATLVINAFDALYELPAKLTDESAKPFVFRLQFG
jgi:hypothetical protein